MIIIISRRFIFGCIMLLVGCGKQPELANTEWVLPSVISSSIDGFAGGIRMYRLRDAIVGIQSLQGGGFKKLLLSQGNNTWIELARLTVPSGYCFGALDQMNKNVLFQKGQIENNLLVMSALFGDVIQDFGLEDGAKRKWIINRKSFFGEYGADKEMTDIGLGIGLINHSDMYLPYCVKSRGISYNGKSRLESWGPCNSGVFYSNDSGATWKAEQVSDFCAIEPTLYKSRDYYYYFATGGMGVNDGWTMWFSRKKISSDLWEHPKLVTKTYAGTNERHTGFADGNVIHVCWMDRRHNMWRFNIDGPPIENDDIVYCRRKDLDSNWGKDVVLSKNVLYCYAPSVSAEGDRIVVAWAGIASAGRHHSEYDPNNIYYVTSKDCGSTWTKPLMVTDGAKYGIVSGKPQVMLLNGVIHLFYIQGKLEKSDQLSPGLTRLVREPWPIYYTQRPFPN